MNVARFNFSHGTHESHQVEFNRLKKIREKMGIHVGALLDTKGPDVRLKTFKEPQVMLNEGQLFTLFNKEVEGDENGVSITHARLADDVEEGTRLLFDDGNIELIVTEINDLDVVCKVINSGIIKSNKGVNIPGVRLSMPYMSKKDKEDIVFAIKNGFDFIAASFVSRAQDILDVRRVLDKHKCTGIKVIAKIENAEGVENIADILSVCDGIMIARGDMGVEIDIARLPAIQKKLINMCYSSGRPVITATQMLESMMYHPRPTRAEVSDVANAVYDSTSAVMLSGETAIGKFPLQAVASMAKICLETESNINYKKRFSELDVQIKNISDAVCHSTVTAAHELSAKAIVVCTQSGITSRLVSRFRPQVPILSITTNAHAYRQLALSWGVIPSLTYYYTNTDELFGKAIKAAKDSGLVKKKDIVIITAGMPIGTPSGTNLMRIEQI
jgi:pyruvate kinase